MTKVDYPDTEAGAIQAMRDMSSYDMTSATAIPDPQIAGVWLVTHREGRSIAYLTRNDFEDVA
jgi:hypothetical protein